MLRVQEAWLPAPSTLGMLPDLRGIKAWSPDYPQPLLPLEPRPRPLQ